MRERVVSIALAIGMVLFIVAIVLFSVFIFGGMDSGGPNCQVPPGC